MRKLVWAVCLVGVICANGGRADTANQKKPNILFLLADDMGYGELGCYGQEKIKTPFLDALAKNGLRFTDFYGGDAVCAPSRAVLMTGIHTGHLNIRGNDGLLSNNTWGRIALQKESISLGDMLKGAGYQTAFIGKWHLGIPEDVSTWAARRGFDYAVQEQWGKTADGRKLDIRDHWVNGSEESIRYNYKQYGCLDEFRTDLALNYVENELDAEKPFFLLMSYRSPHAHEKYLRQNDDYANQGWPELERRHASRITMLDAQIKRLLAQLEKMGELENTLVLFTSDNGPHGEWDHDPLFFASSGQYKGYKRDLYEGGIRVPCIAYWKGKIRAGKTTDHPAIFYDVMPTLAEVAGIEPPAQTDGISFLPELLGHPQPKHDHLYWEIQVGNSRDRYRQAVRQGQWKAVRYGVDGELELYRIQTDPRESKNVANSYPEVAERMAQILRAESTPDEHFPFAGHGVK
jgi:arylsulfatase A-like enzyme